MKNIYFILFIIWFYFFLYNPPINIIPVSTFHITGLVGVFLFIFNYNSIVNWASLRLVKKIYLFFSFIIIHLIFVSLVYGNSYVGYANFIYLVIYTIPSVFFVINYFIKNNIKQNQILNIFFIVGFLFSLTSILAIASPGIQQLFQDNDEESLKYSVDLIGHRNFGYASGLTYATPVFQGLLSGVSYYRGIKEKSSIYFFLIPFYLISATINARTGMSIGFITILFVFLAVINLKNLVNYIFGLIIFFIFISLFFRYFKASFIDHAVFEWIEIGIEEISLLFQGEKIGFFTIVFQPDWYRIPDGLGLIFGEGAIVLGGYKNYPGIYFNGTDSGWINDIWLGGILYLILLYSFFIKSLLVIREKFYLSTIAYLLFITFLVVNFKGAILSSINAVTIFILIISIYSYHYKEIDKTFSKML